MLSVVAVIAVALGVSTAGAARADGKGEPRRMVNALPPVSLASGQTLRVNFLNAGRSPFEFVPCIFDADGAHIKTGPHVRLLPGQTRTFDLSRAEAGRAREPLVEVRAGVHVDESDLKSLVVSGEVFDDATGKSSLYVPGANNPPDPVRAGESTPPEPVHEGDSTPPEPVRPGEVTRSLAPVGITAGQTLRVTFVNVGSSPLEVVPCVLDGEGFHLKTGPHVRLAPGQMLSFDMSRAETPTHAGIVAGDETAAPRLVVRGAAHVRQSDARNLLVTGAVIEEATGRSSLYLAPGTIRGFNPQPDPPREGEIR